MLKPNPPQVRVFGDGDFRRLLIHEGRFSRNEISVLIKETPEKRLLCAFHYVRFQKKRELYQNQKVVNLQSNPITRQEYNQK